MKALASRTPVWYYRPMKSRLRRGFLALLPSMALLGCSFVPNDKFLEFWNGDYPAKVTVIDDKDKKSEFTVDPGWTHGWYQAVIGDFSLVHIETENGIEGLFTIHNKYKRKILPFDIMTMTRRAQTEGYEIEHDVTILSYGITIKIIEDRFYMEYDPAKYDILAYFNYDEDSYIFNQNKITF